nr:helicase-primase subunit [Murid betaherpesvirus 2]
MEGETAARSARWFRGTVAHWSVHCFLPENHSALLQYYFLEAGEDDRLTPRVLFHCVPIDRRGPERAGLLRTYGSIVASSLAESGAVAAAAAAAVADLAAASRTTGRSVDTDSDDEESARDDDDDDDDDGGGGDDGRAGCGGKRRREASPEDTEDVLGRLEERLGRRSRALAYLLLYGGGPTARVLNRPFTPIEVLVGTRPGDLEILGARPWEDAAPGLLRAVATFPVYRIRVPGAYRSDAPVQAAVAARVPAGGDGEPSSPPGPPSPPEARRTRAHERLCRGRPSRPLAFVVRAGSRRIVFEDVAGAGADGLAAAELQTRTVHELFEVRDVVWMRRRFRVCVPRGFLALAFNDDQCLLLLRDALARLFDEVYAGYDGTYPLFDFLGPNMFRYGGPRSVFLPGFPCVLVYSVPWPHNAVAECGADAIRHQRALAGLPDILGAVGKAPVLDPPGRTVRFVGGPAVAELEVYFTELRVFRLNARWCSPRDVSGDAVGDLDCSDAHLYADRRGVCRIFLRGLRLAVIRSCLPGDRDAYPFVLEDSGRRTDLAAATLFLRRLRDGSPRVYRVVRALENYLSKVVTDACDRAGFAWILVRHDCEFYVRQRAGGPPAPGRLEAVVRAALDEAWAACFGPQFACPAVPEVGVSRAGVLLAVDRFVLGGFEDAPDDCVPGWISSAGRFLAEAVHQAFDAADWSAKTAVLKIMATHVLRMAARRHELGFWVERFAPGRNRVDDRSPAVDASEFSGVRVAGGLIATQASEAALSDRIDYENYVRRTFFMLRVCLRRVIRVLADERLAEESDRPPPSRGEEGPAPFPVAVTAEELADEALREFEDAFADAQRHVLSRYGIFFRVC